jgi:hypothetical protein
MLEKLKQAAVNLAALDLERVALQALRQNEQAVLDFNREQLQDSFDREGEPLGEYASIAYANMKGRITVDLKLTGGFYNAMYLKADEFPVLFDSRDEKTTELKAKYGEEIFGTDKVNTERVAQQIVLSEVSKAILENI